MRVLEIRRHSLTKKGTGRGSGSHLSQEGVALARQIGQTAGPFDRVLVSPVPRTIETAIAMGFAVDDVLPALGPEDGKLFAEVGHHERWTWEQPFVEFDRLVRLGGVTALLGQLQVEAWRRILASLPAGGHALAISHGRVIECGLVACLPQADYAAWGAPFRHCEGVRLVEDDRHAFEAELLRLP